MFVHVLHFDGSQEWMNEKIVQNITKNQDATFTIHHFNGQEVTALDIKFER